MRISACIPFRQRAGIPGRDECALELVIDNLFAQGVDEILLHNQGLEPLNIDRSNLFCIDIPLDRWRMGLGYNICATHAIGDIIILTLGGMLLSKNIVTDTAQGKMGFPDYVASADRFVLCTEAATQAICLTGVITPEIEAGAILASKKAGFGAYCAMRRHDYLMYIGGYDSEHWQWGRDDRDFHKRAEMLGYKYHRAKGTIYHLADGFPGTRREDPGYIANEALSKEKVETQWWRNELRKA